MPFEIRDVSAEEATLGPTEDGRTLLLGSSSRLLPGLDLSIGSAECYVIITREAPPELPRAERGRQAAPYQEALAWIKDATGLPDERIARLLGVSRQTLHAWQRGGQISDPNRQRLLAVRELLERAARRHATPSELAAWLDTPRGADGRTPAVLIEAGELDRARLYAISAPSPGLARPPSWVRRGIPEAFRAGAERRQEPVPPEPVLPDLEDDALEDGEATEQNAGT